MKERKLLYLLLFKWLTETIYFIGSVFIIATSILLLAINIFGWSSDFLHILSLNILVLYVFLGLLVTKSIKNTTMSINYFKLVSALLYVCIISLMSGVYLEWLTHPWVIIVLAIPFAISLLAKKIYPKVISKTLFIQDHDADIEGDFSNMDGLKKAMLDSIANSISPDYRDLVFVQGRKFKQDTNGNVGGLFDVVLKKNVLWSHNPKLSKATLQFKK